MLLRDALQAEGRETLLSLRVYPVQQDGIPGIVPEDVRGESTEVHSPGEGMEGSEPGEGSSVEAEQLAEDAGRESG